MTLKTSNTFILKEPSEKLLTTWYAEQVVEGNIIASTNVILACKRHLEELEKYKLNVLSEEFPWTFDEELGHRPIQFIENIVSHQKVTLNSSYCKHGSILRWVVCLVGFIRKQNSDALKRVLFLFPENKVRQR